MKKNSSPAKFLDWVFDILYWGAIAAVGITLVVILGYGLFFWLNPDVTPTASILTELHLGNVTLRPTEEFLPEKSAIFRLNMTNLVFLLIQCVIGLGWAVCARDCLTPMLQGTPFDGTVSQKLKKLAVITCVQGVTANLLNYISFNSTINTYWEYIFEFYGRIGIFGLEYTFDWNFLITTAVLFLAYNIFRHGEELQQLSDETL